MTDFVIMYNKMMQDNADKKGMTLEEYLEFDGICYQHTQGYFSNNKERKALLDRYHELIKIGNERLKNKS